MAEKTKPEGEETEAKGGGKKKLLVIVAVLLVAVGAGAYFFLFSGGTAEAKTPEAGSVLALDPIAVNLAGGGYLKIGVTLQLTTDAVSEGEGAVDASKALDLIISTFSQADPADVNTARDALKEALQKKIVDAYKQDGTETVMGIYYNQYVTQ
jgi:flagellar FliL protein